MPNVAKVLKEEISRIARKEIKSAVARITKPTTKTRKAQAALKRRLAVLEKQAKQILSVVNRLEAAQPKAAPEATSKIRVTAKGMRSLRRKLRLSQGEFGRLLGVSEQAVYMWERGSGALRVRETTRTALLAIRGFGAREARAHLESMAAEKPSPKRRKRK